MSKKEQDEALKKVQGVAQERGLEPDCIETLVNFITGVTGIATVSNNNYYFPLEAYTTAFMLVHLGKISLRGDKRD